MAGRRHCRRLDGGMLIHKGICVQERIWRTIGASVIGTSHQARGAPCQDAHYFFILPQQTLLIAVADGAGSARRADEGARLVVQQAAKALDHRLAQGQPENKAGWRQVMIEAFEEGHNHLARYAETEATDLHAFATTLTCVLATSHWLVVGQIGDGAVVVQMANEKLCTVIKPQRGEYANETYFLTMANALQYVDIRVVRAMPQGLVVMTDGMLRLALKLPSYRPHAPFFKALLTFVSEAEDLDQAQIALTAFLASERVCDGTDDDKTLVLATRSSVK